GLMNMMLSGALSRGERPAPEKIAPCTMMLAPLSHSMGYCQLLLAVMLGSRLLFSADRAVPHIAATVRRERATSIVGLDRGSLNQLLWRDDAAAELASIRS